MELRHGSLFSGIGGFDLAAEWAGWTNVFHCEINPFGRKVLNHYWNNTKSYEDITKTDFSVWRGKCDVITGGFPCQDASNANHSETRTTGLDGERTGLFFHFARAIDEIRPKYIVAENVSNLLRTNDGRDFRTILGVLAGMGYNAEWRVTRASEVGAAHHRARLYVVAYSNDIGLQEGQSFFRYVAETSKEKRRSITGTTASVGVSWSDEPSVSVVDDGVSCNLDGISIPKFRSESIKAAGNAIVPQVAYQIFKSINLYEESCNGN